MVFVSTRRVDPDQDTAGRVPLILRVSAALSWRFLAVVAALYVISQVLGYVGTVVVPVAIALLLAALLSPAVAKLVSWMVPRGVATAVVLVGGLAVVVGVLTFVINEFSNGLPELQTQVGRSLDTINNWLINGPLHLSQQQLQDFLARIPQTLRENTSTITSGALTTAVTVGELLTGLLLVLFTLIFFLHDGDGIWRFLIRAVPSDVRNRVDVAGRRGFASLVSFVRATAVVAVVDAVGIGIGIAIVGVPLAVPLAALVFLGAFVPIVGAVLTGTVAVLVALVANGLVPALIVLAIVVGVMQLEGHVLQPLLLGRAVKLHPLAVVLAIAVGMVVSGIAGALLAVPLLAVLNAGVRSLLHHEDDLVPPEQVDVTRPGATRPSKTGDEA
ncbi:putative PurR-regulated permease PerM [Goodfellowiella coeruleoviolacea]|uniref:PurR-regulated permease PerM n=1 Tax=Goodfellowiella coeruleoviolacea TaxID=334858 RepID=A0AAE3GIS0_9PSEU|nr:putative PurR-regulated permease PerM [Goodfellowiella coeruleoviolacea]